MKNRRPCLTALSLFWFLWDIKEPILLFVKCRGHRPRWCGTTVKWAGWKWIGTQVLFHSLWLCWVTVANSKKNLKYIAMPGLPGQGFIIIIIIIIMSHRASRRIRPPRCLTNTFCLEQPLRLLSSSSTPLCFTLSQLSVTWGLLWGLSAFGLPAGFVPRASIGWFSNRTGMPVYDGARKLNNSFDRWQNGKLGTRSWV